MVCTTDQDSVIEIKEKLAEFKLELLEKLAGIEITLPHSATGVRCYVKLVETTAIGSPGKDFRVGDVEFTFDILFGCDNYLQ